MTQQVRCRNHIFYVVHHKVRSELDDAVLDSYLETIREIGKITTLADPNIIRNGYAYDTSFPYIAQGWLAVKARCVNDMWRQISNDIGMKWNVEQ
jgi:hypothetical protein